MSWEEESEYGRKDSSKHLPAGHYTMYVGLGCLSTTAVAATNNATHTSIFNISSSASHQQIHEIFLECTLCVCVCVCECECVCVCVCVSVCVYRHKAQLVWYMKHKQHSSSYSSHQQLHYTHTYTRTHTYICTHICIIAP